MRVTPFIVISIIMALSVFVQQLPTLDIPAGVFAPKEGGYVYAENSDVFDPFSKNGITIEIWFYNEESPTNWDNRWILIDKPRSYSIYLDGSSPGAKTINDRLVGFINCYTYSGKGGGSLNRVWLLQDNPYLNCWVHIAFQIRGTGNNIEQFKAFDGGIMTGGECFSIFGYAASSDPLFIGGGDEYKSFKGWIDDLRISKGWRYEPFREVKPERIFRADQNTLALWHFDEGPDSRIYRDSSGNGHTLSAGGIIAIDSEGKSTTTWGMLKKH